MEQRRRLVDALVLVLAVTQVGQGIWMLADPGSFFDVVGPFGTRNDHYVRDAGTFTLALGVALAIAYLRPAWRAGAVGFAFFQFLFHSINHLADIGDAHPHRAGPIDFALLALVALVLGWLLVQVLREPSS